ncbi:MAG: response regulator [Nitrospira sp.]|nr:response regulator [Candidatus Manganitrophaceae bacterium]HIL34504.1 response regulator [Candidatus Manganitrophaceae bacterium]
MSAACPKCQSELPLDPSSFNKDGTTSCPACQATLKVEISIEVIDALKNASDPGDGAAMPIDALSDGQRKVLLCIDGEGTRELIKEILVEPQFSVLDVPTGKEAFSSIRQHRPAITLIDMGLSEIVGTELCSEIKNDPELRETAVILVASMYDRSTNRPASDSLLGADAYIDRSLIQKRLLDKVENLFVREEAVDDEEKTPANAMEEDVSFVAVAEATPAEESDQASGVEAPEAAAAAEVEESAEQKDAKRLARIIVSDIALYNPKKVDEGIQDDTFFELLKEEIEEGKEHYLSRVSETLSQPSAYLDEAFKDYINKRKSSS